ncbi:MAG TPA: alpha/beta hydrolase family protein [Nocardioides sp.]|uniref:alpha/beta hydrolase n=1 Tax=uncultured Nocardioides sp. TaxID=198441 RepID=UPI000ED0DB0E|nr:alpha/beta hydrolase family protein [uncultured Nocardioides sp.]HCB04627.1 esterase [Nocardioides sp.]HRD61951.1 alpha/beta hydrolase family protein [Nocardioides sp.]HRI98594.1 alpha/beta hydrolase family protein [Nocardioides sp.]HRK48256.1 alpha/beta hydrolase family protein [Nocardioides sp.]
MALLTCDFFSESLMCGTSITVVLPQRTEEQIGIADVVRDGPPPVLYLLHGLSDDHTAWLRYTSIERYAAARGLAVVMPAAGRSFYADEAHGHRYWSYISEELPRVVSQFLRVSDGPADTFVAGLSMGGYGALKLALTHPERYAAAACLSGALDLVAFSKNPDRDEVMGRVFDHQVRPSDDVFALLRTARSIPPLHVSCGTDDWLYASCQRFAEEATAAGVEVTTDFRPGDHVWSLWDAVIQDVIAWLPVGS